MQMIMKTHIIWGLALIAFACVIGSIAEAFMCGVEEDPVNGWWKPKDWTCAIIVGAINCCLCLLGLACLLGAFKKSGSNMYS